MKALVVRDNEYTLDMVGATIEIVGWVTHLSMLFAVWVDSEGRVGMVPAWAIRMVDVGVTA